LVDRAGETERVGTEEAALRLADRWRVGTGQHGWLLAIAGLTGLAAVLRLALAGQSLLGDELLTYAVVDHATPGQVLDALNHSIESTPPLAYLLAWASGRLGSDPALIRIPSLVAGIALVPTIGALGAQLRSKSCGLLASAIVALSPFALFYSVEARAYALVAFLVSASAACLLAALRRGGKGWWVAFAVISIAAMYTHYTAAFPLAAEAIWAFVAFPSRRRAIGLSSAATAAAFLAWVPWLQGRALGLIAAFYPLTPVNVFKAPVISVFGSPQAALSAIPGKFGLALAGAGLALAASSLALVARSREWVRPPAPREGARLGSGWLILGLAVSTPAGLLLYDVVGDDLYNPRNLSASVPGLVLGIAAIVTAAPRRLAWGASALVLAALAIGAGRSLEARYQRPPVNEAADFINARARPGDLVIDTPAIPVGFGLSRELTIYLRPDLRTLIISGVVGPGDPRLGPLANAEAWRRIVGRRRAFVVAPVVPSRPDVRVAPAGSGARLVEQRLSKGLQAISVAEYAPPR